MSGELALN